MCLTLVLQDGTPILPAMRGRQQPEEATVSESETPSSIKPKAHNVRGPDGKLIIVWAPTKQGAIAKAKAAQVKEEKWTAELSTGEDLFLAARNHTPMIDAPPELTGPDPQLDAFKDAPNGND